jgi:crossover junction endodeoxyribonuclease RusA
MTNSFFVAGEPVTQGSMSVFRGRAVHRNAAKLMQWRNTIAEHYTGDMHTGPMSIQLDFIMEKPRTSVRTYPRLDIDKLVRAVLDALTGYAYKDDSQVVSVIATKMFGPASGVKISLREESI